MLIVTDEVKIIMFHFLDGWPCDASFYFMIRFCLYYLHFSLSYVLPPIFFWCQTDPAAAAATQANKEEVDSRSVFVGNVRPLFNI